MKEQYVGDENDYRKYALLRALAASSLKLGVCWMLTPPDGRADGNKLGYLNNPARWRHYDPQVFDLLHATVHVNAARKLDAVERSGLLQDARFVNDVVPDRADLRREYFASALAALKGVDLVFFDPDNGIEVKSKPKGSKDSSKFVFLDEIAPTFAAGHSVLIYQHFTRQKRSEFVSEKCSLLGNVCQAQVRTFATPHAVFLLAVQIRHKPNIDVSMRTTNDWSPEFLASADRRSQG